jgi:hypothetical protein
MNLSGDAAMADGKHGFDEQPPRGITRYVVWSLALSLGLGIFLHADGYFDDVDDMLDEMIGQTSVAPDPSPAPAAGNG